MIDQSAVNLLDLLGCPGAKKTASTNGGEYHLPTCPFCGAGEDRFVAMPNQNPPRAWCRKCGWHGDSIAFVMDRDSCTFAEALITLGLRRDSPRNRLKSRQGITVSPTPLKSHSGERPKPKIADSPQNAAWKLRMIAFAEYAAYQLRNDPEQLEYLYRRGLSDFVIESAMLGFNPQQVDKEMIGDKEVKYFAGMTIPHYHNGAIEAVKIRNPAFKNKYANITGSRTAGLYRRDRISLAETAVIITESELDALALQSLDPCADLWTGRHEWIAVACPAKQGLKYAGLLIGKAQVILAFDNDDAGRKATAAWRGKFPDVRALNIPACYKDVGAWIVDKGSEAVLTELETLLKATAI